MGLFREYDLRGIVGQELTDSIAEQVARAYCTFVKDRGVKTISVGRDGRLSSPGLFKALVRGLLAGGMNVVDVGVCPSPLVYFSLFQLPVDGGIMITGTARVTRGDEVFDLKIGHSTEIPVETRHRLENPGQETLHIIEVQNGPYLGEDDIVRFQDDYGRNVNR